MRIWIDTEFNEFKGDLISIALIDENERKFYFAVPCENPGSWVAEHVMPILGVNPKPLKDVQILLQYWLSTYDSIHIISDWPEDLKHFLDLLIVGPGLRINTPTLTLEVRRDLDSIPSEVPHNALADVIAIRKSHLALEKV